MRRTQKKGLFGGVIAAAKRSTANPRRTGKGISWREPRKWKGKSVI